MSNEVKVKDVMDYFGEYLNEEQAEQVIELVKGSSFFEKMNGIRNILLRGGYDVIFRGVYRRAK